jgi:hypothetical protein
MSIDAVLIVAILRVIIVNRKKSKLIFLFNL